MSVFKRWNGNSWEIIGPTISNSRVDDIKQIIAPEYESNKGYSIGDYVIYSDNLYKCKVQINSSGEIWNSTHWNRITIADEVDKLKDSLLPYNTYNLLRILSTPSSYSHQGATYTWNDYTCTITGEQTTGISINNIISIESIPPEIIPGGTYEVHYASTNDNIRLSFAFWDSNNTVVADYYFNTGVNYLNIPTDAVKWVVRLYISANKNPNGFVSQVELLSCENINNLRYDVNNFNAFDLISKVFKYNRNNNGIDFIWNEDKTSCTCTGTASDYAYCTIAGTMTEFPEGFKPGGTYYFKFKTTTNDLEFGFFYYNNDSYIGLKHIKSEGFLTIPITATSIIIMIGVPSGRSLDHEVISDIAVLNTAPNQALLDSTLKQYDPPSSTFSVFSDMPNNTFWNGGKSYFENSITDNLNLKNNYTYYIYKINDCVFITAPILEQSYIGMLADSGVQYWMSTRGLPTKQILADNTDLDTITKQGIWFLNSGRNYIHSPFNNIDYGGMMLVFHFDPNNILQIVSLANSGKIFVRSSLLGNFPSTWGSNGTIINYNNTYTTEHYDNTYNITCSPTITTDTNNYLASTGDNTDRTGDIQTMLNTTGVCRLGPGVFYITGVEVPNFGAIIGSGKRSNIILASSVTAGYAVKLKTYATIKDVYIRGNTTNLSMSDLTPTDEDIGKRHGILFEGTANAQSNPSTFYRSYIEGCLICDFVGGGITCNNTGLSPSASLVVGNCQIARCGAGVNLAYFTEFHRFTNITAQECWYGCIDNGGNNNFANCDFSMNKIALLIDNSTDQSRNNTHGTFSACSFHHSDNTYSGGAIVSVGTCMRILGASAGEIFTGCQIGFGNIEIDNSKSIRFDGCNFLRMTALQITNSPLVVFSDCNFYDASASPLTQSGNTTLKFLDCYKRDGSIFNPMS